jgi:lipopolysaccharide export system protein LptC
MQYGAHRVLTITGHAFKLQADTMTVDLGSETAVLKGKVKGTFREENASLF